MAIHIIDFNFFLISIDGKHEIPLVEHATNDFFFGWALGRELSVLNKVLS